jgi:hypothetical protein
MKIFGLWVRPTDGQARIVRIPIVAFHSEAVKKSTQNFAGIPVASGIALPANVILRLCRDHCRNGQNRLRLHLERPTLSPGE